MQLLYMSEPAPGGTNCTKTMGIAIQTRRVKGISQEETRGRTSFMMIQQFVFNGKLEGVFVFAHLLVT